MRHRSTFATTLAISAVAALALVGCTSTPADEPPTVEEPAADDEVAEAWRQSASDREVDEAFRYDCPAGGTLEYTVWGGADGYYTDDSSICVAAVHAGLITTSGGTVRVLALDGRESYQGSTANGVTTLDYGSWGGTIIFPDSDGAPDVDEPTVAEVEEPTASPEEIELAWNQSASDREVDEAFRHDCPAGGSLVYTVWGGADGYYTADSSICVAAVHAGLITTSGGTVRVLALDGRESYQGSTANGVTTLDYGSWGGTFILPDAAGSPGR